MSSALLNQQQYSEDLLNGQNDNTMNKSFDEQHLQRAHRPRVRRRVTREHSMQHHQVANIQEEITNMATIDEQTVPSNVSSQVDYSSSEVLDVPDVQYCQPSLIPEDKSSKSRRRIRRSKTNGNNPPSVNVAILNYSDQFSTANQRDKTYQFNMDTLNDSANVPQDYEHDAHSTIVEDTHKFSSNTESRGTDADPIIDYAQEPLLPLAEACTPLSDILHDLFFYVDMALQETPAEPPDGLTVDESAAIRLYTIEWERPHRSLYSMLNRTLKYSTREELRPYFAYMKLLLTALVKMPCCPPLTVWRGVTKNLSEEFPPGSEVTWWAFSSTTTELTVLESNMYLGKQGARTLFSVEAINGRTIRDHSHFVTEDEILLLPGTHMVVKSQFSPANDLYIIHLKQVVPKEVLLEPPFEDAVLYPKNKQPWYRKKRFAIPLCLLMIMSIVAAVVGGTLGSKKSVLLKNPFASGISSDTGPSPTAMVYGYFDSDTYVDIAVLNLGDKTIDILRNSGNATYPKVTTTDTGTGPVFAALCPVDKDNSYLFVLNNVDGTVSVMNVGTDGTLEFNEEYPAGADPRAAVCGDFNNDAIVDLVIISGYDSVITLALSANNESFSQLDMYPLGNYLTAVIAADLNNDFAKELIIADWRDFVIYILNISEHEKISLLSTWSVNSYPGSLLEGDFNNDGNIDIVVGYYYSYSITILLGDGHLRFLETIIYTLQFEIRSMTTADLNNDSNLDLIFNDVSTSYVYVLLGYGNVTFETPRSYTVINYSIAVFVSDFNNDSMLDIAVANGENNTISILINTGNGELYPQIKYASGSYPIYILPCDIMNNKIIDLLVVNWRDNNVALLTGNGDGTFQARIPFTINFKADSMAAGDFNNDSLTDLVLANTISNSAVVILTIKNNTLQINESYPTNRMPSAVATGDFNKDGNLDIVVVNEKNDSITILLGSGYGTFQNHAVFPTSRRPGALTVNDFNRDGTLDLAVVGVPDQNISVLIGDGKGSFQSHVSYSVGTNPTCIIAVDLTNDKVLDLVVTNGGDDTLSILVGHGDGTFEPQVIRNTTENPRVVLYGDFNLDKLIDLAVISERTSEIDVLFNTDNITFNHHITVNTPTSPSAGICHDLNKDEKVDIAIISKKRYSLSVYLNNVN